MAELAGEPSGAAVHRLRLSETITNEGTALGQTDIIHTSPDIAAARLTPGEWVGIVFDDGWLAKLVRLDPPDGAGPETIVDESLSGVEVPDDSPLARVGVIPRSYSPARPWLERFLPHLPDDVEGFLFLTEVETELLLRLIPQEGVTV
jgi:hypothetical protein